MTPKRTGRRIASTLATTTHPSASSGFLPRALRRGRQQAALQSQPVKVPTLQLNGGSNYATIIGNWNGVSTDHATFEVWIKTATQAPQVIFNGSPNVQPLIVLANDRLTVYWNGAGSSEWVTWTSADTTPVSNGIWHHIAVVFSNGAITFYKDGIATADTLSVTTATAASGLFQLGAALGSFGGFNGQMYDARVWSVARTPYEINYQRFYAPTGTESGLNLATRFDVSSKSFVNIVTNAGGGVYGGQVVTASDFPAAPPTQPATGLLLTGGPNDSGDLGSITTQANSDGVTFECWIQMSTAPGVRGTAQTLLAFPIEQDVPRPVIAYMGNDKLGVFWYGQPVLSNDTTPIADGLWHHIAVVFDRAYVTFYKDGVPTNEALLLGGSLDLGPSMQIGPALSFVGSVNHAGVSLSAFNGTISNVRMWDSARAVGEIQGCMYAQFTTPQQGLLAESFFSRVAALNFITNIVTNHVASPSGSASVVDVQLPLPTPPATVWTYPITGVAPQGPVLTPQGAVYAENVAASGSTPAGNYLRSLDFQTNQISWTYAVHDNSKLPTPVLPAAVGAASGVAYVGAQATNSTGATFTELHAVDGATGLAVWATPAKLTATNFLTRPVVGAGQVVIGATALDPSGGGTSTGLFWVDTATSQTVQSHPNLIGAVDFMSDPVIQDGVAYVALSFGTISSVAAVDLGANSATSYFPQHLISGGIAVDGVNVYATCKDGHVVAMNIATRAISWSKQMSNLPINSKPVALGSSVYIGSTDGILYALDATSGDEQWRVNTNSAITTDLVVEDGILYFANQGNVIANPPLSPTFYSIDPASQGADTLTYPVGNTDTILFDQGASNGVVYFYGKQTVYAVNMDTIIHEFNVDTKLIVEDYNTSVDPNTMPVGNDTSYRVTLMLNDPLKMPRVNQGVKIWSSDTLYISNMVDPQGNPLQIGPSAPLWLQTDGSGQVSVAVSAYDDGSHGGNGSPTSTPNITSPVLYAWANFMMPEEVITIYLDHEHLTKMSNVQGESPSTGLLADQNTLYLNQATGYDGQPLIMDQFQHSAALTAIASTIRNTIGTRSTAVNLTAPVGVLQNAAASKYIAFPATMQNVLYQANSSQPSTRSYVAGSDAVFTIDLSSGTPNYQAGTFDPTLPAQFAARASAPGVAGLGLDIHDFYHNVMKNGEKLAKMAWKTVNNVVTAVIHTAENTYNCVIYVLEDAVKAVAGFLKAVVADIRKVIEWLSALFDWKNIVINHNSLKNHVLSMLNDISTRANQNVLGQANDIEATYSTIGGNGQSSMQSTGTDVGGQTVQSNAGPNSDPNAVYNTGGQNNATQCKFMHNKAMEGKSSLALPVVGRAYRLYLPLVGSEASARNSLPPVAATTAPNPDTITGAFDTFISSLLTTIENDFKDFPAQLKAKISAMQSKMGDSKSLLSNGLADIMAVFAVLADDLINLGKEIAKDFLIMCSTLLQQLIAWLTTPLEIPFISRLYKAISGNDLTFLDLILLCVAVPTTILLDVITGYPTVEAAGDTQAQADAAGTALIGSVDPAKVGQTFLAIGAVIVNAIAALIDGATFGNAATAEGDPDLPALNKFDLITDTIAWSLNAVWSRAWSEWDEKDWVFWSLQAWPQCVNLVYIYKDSTIDNQVARDVFYGVGLLAMASIYAAHWPDSYRDATDKAKGLVISTNVFTSLAWIVEICHVGGNTGDLVATAGKILFGEVSAILGFTAALVTIFPPASSAQQARPDITTILSLA
jgi:outer membrane protein assembly factor BamB